MGRRGTADWHGRQRPQPRWRTLFSRVCATQGGVQRLGPSRPASSARFFVVARLLCLFPVFGGAVWLVAVCCPRSASYRPQWRHLCATIPLAGLVPGDCCSHACFFFVPFRCSRLSQECPLTFLSSSSSPVCTRRQASANRGFISRPRSEPLGMRHHTPCWDPGTRQTVRTKKPPLCHCIDTVPPPSPDTRCHTRGLAGSGVRIQLLVPSPS